jgi:lambda family phage portal protein
MAFRLNILDRAISAVSPQAGLRRAQARAALDAMAYAAGRRSERLGRWRTDRTGPNAAVTRHLALLRDRSRDMVRDNPYAARAVDLRADYEIGTGIEAQFEDRRAQAVWDRWIARCDHAGILGLNAMMALAARTRSEAGEALILHRRLTARQMRARRLEVPLTLELREPDLLPEVMPAEGVNLRVIAGIEFGPDGQRDAYWMHPAHPGDPTAAIGSYAELIRYSADEVQHIYRPMRPGAVRGVPDCAPALLRLRQLDDFEDAALQSAISQAMLGVFFKTDGSIIDAPATQLGQDGAPILPSFDLEPGMVQALPPGIEPAFLTPTGSPSFEPFALHQLMAAATGWGVPYDLLTGDLRQANYSSLRAGRLAFKRAVERSQWEVWVPVMEGIRAAFAEACQAALLDVDATRCTWSPPRFEMLDPSKEVGAAIASVRAGFETWPQAVGSFGYGWRNQIEEIAAANAALDEKGIILDTDPRRVANSGGAQDPRQNAAIEISATGAALPRQPAPTEPAGE